MRCRTVIPRCSPRSTLMRLIELIEGTGENLGELDGIEPF